MLSDGTPLNGLVAGYHTCKGSLGPRRFSAALPPTREPLAAGIVHCEDVNAFRHLFRVCCVSQGVAPNLQDENHSFKSVTNMLEAVTYTGAPRL